MSRIFIPFEWRGGRIEDLLTNLPEWLDVGTDKREENEQDGQERVYGGATATAATRTFQVVG